MGIADVSVVLLTGPCTEDPWLLPFKRLRSAAFIEVRGDDGVVGVGETYAGYFFPESVPLIVDYLRPILVADDDAVRELDVPTLTARMRTCCAYWGRVGLGSAVIAGIEAALWDLKGKLAGVPVYQLLAGPGGARHDTLPTYATGGPSPWPQDQLLAKVEYYLGLGFHAFKVASGYLDARTRTSVEAAPGPEAAAQVEVEKVAAIRQEFGPDVAILLDGHMGHREGASRWDLRTATTVLDALAPFDVHFFEEPLAYGDVAGYAHLAANSPVPVAGGEQLSTFAEFKVFADHDAFTIAQPDAAWIGLGEFVDVARMYADAGLSIAPHAWGAGGAVMQNVHGAFAAPSVDIVELPPAAGPLHREIWGDSLRLVDGVLHPPEAPGLGVTLSDEIKRRFPFQPGAEEFSSVPGKLLRS